MRCPSSGWLVASDTGADAPRADYRIVIGSSQPARCAKTECRLLADFVAKVFFSGWTKNFSPLDEHYENLVGATAATTSSLYVML